MPAARSRFFFPEPPFPVLVQYMVESEDFVADAKFVLQLDEESYQRLADQLATTSGFLDRRALVEAASQCLDTQQDAERIGRIVYRLGEILHEAGMEPAQAMDVLANAISEKTESLSEDERDRLSNRLRTLLLGTSGLSKHFKAQSLVEVLGGALESFQVICDVRPVFDPKRQRIEGAVPICVARIEYTSADGESSANEFRISEQQIDEMEQTVATAKQKLQLIKLWMQDQDVTVPHTKATIQ